MQLATVLTPISNANLRLAAQCGVEAVVLRYPAEGPDQLAVQQKQLADYGLQVCAVEGYLPIERIKTGADDGTDLRAIQDLLRTM
ncbi:MAG: mannonate dehydratase, partial [Planctomycetaceae bacterium]|nr:mannonate dehydratase [Planctomycetaceae bacterium]